MYVRLIFNEKTFQMSWEGGRKTINWEDRDTDSYRMYCMGTDRWPCMPMVPSTCIAGRIPTPGSISSGVAANYSCRGAHITFTVLIIYPSHRNRGWIQPG